MFNTNKESVSESSKFSRLKWCIGFLMAAIIIVLVTGRTLPYIIIAVIFIIALVSAIILIKLIKKLAVFLMDYPMLFGIYVIALAVGSVWFF